MLSKSLTSLPLKLGPHVCAKITAQLSSICKQVCLHFFILQPCQKTDQKSGVVSPATTLETTSMSHACQGIACRLLYWHGKQPFCYFDARNEFWLPQFWFPQVYQRRKGWRHLPKILPRRGKHSNRPANFQAGTHFQGNNVIFWLWKPKYILTLGFFGSHRSDTSTSRRVIWS